MPTRYFDRLSDPSVRTITNAGSSQPGPPGGSGWQLVQLIPGLPAGRLAMWVTMLVGNMQRSGAQPQAGIIQLCMGTPAGIRSGIHYWSFPIRDSQLVNGLEGRRVSFLMIFDDAFAEPEFAAGATFPGGDLAVYARFFWNGDPQAYTVNFDVSNVEATWMLLEDMDAGDRHVFATSTSAPVPQLANPLVSQRYSDSWPALDETWLTFAVAYFLPSLSPNNVGDRTALFAFWDLNGAGALVNVASDKWILGGGTSNPIPGPLRYASDNIGTGSRQDCIGFQDVRQFSDAARTLNLDWIQWNGGTSSLAAVLHQRVVSIRLDVLAPLLIRNDEQIDDVVEYYSNLAITSREIALEVGPAQLTFEPYVFGALEVIPQSPTAEQVNLYLRDSTGEVFVDHPTYQQGALDTTQQNMLASSNGIGFGDPQFRYEMLALKRTIPIGVNQSVRNVSLAVFHPIRDPDGQAPTLPGVGDPVALVPGAEGPAEAPSLTYQPNAQIEDTPEMAQERFRGHTAYVRTWSTWLKARRGFALFWEPLTLAERDIVAAEVAPGQLFAWQAPGGSTIICCATERPTITGLGAGTWRVQVGAVELVYTA